MLGVCLSVCLRWSWGGAAGGCLSPVPPGLGEGHSSLAAVTYEPCIGLSVPLVGVGSLTVSAAPFLPLVLGSSGYFCASSRFPLKMQTGSHPASAWNPSWLPPHSEPRGPLPGSEVPLWPHLSPPLGSLGLVRTTTSPVLRRTRQVPASGTCCPPPRSSHTLPGVCAPFHPKDTSLLWEAPSHCTEERTKARRGRTPKLQLCFSLPELALPLCCHGNPGASKRGTEIGSGGSSEPPALAPLLAPSLSSPSTFHFCLKKVLPRV